MSIDVQDSIEAEYRPIDVSAQVVVLGNSIFLADYFNSLQLVIQHYYATVILTKLNYRFFASLNLSEYVLLNIAS